jgi:hypothetical protein
MSAKASPTADPQERALRALLRAIASRDRSTTSRLLAESPLLREEQKEIIRLLLAHGARASDKDSAGRSVKDCVNADWTHALLRPA